MDKLNSIEKISTLVRARDLHLTLLDREMKELLNDVTFIKIAICVAKENNENRTICQSIKFPLKMAI